MNTDIKLMAMIKEIKRRLLVLENSVLTQEGATHGEESTVHADEADVHVHGDTVQHAKETQED